MLFDPGGLVCQCRLAVLVDAVKVVGAHYAAMCYVISTLDDLLHVAIEID